MFYSVGQAGIGQMSWMRMPPSMLGLFLSQYITNTIIQ